MPRRTIDPPPPLAADLAMPWDQPVGDAVAAIAQARAAYGETFAVESGRDAYLFTFTPAGVDAFYALPEESASKGVADYLMLRRKLPQELFDDRRVLPGGLFRRDDVASYLDDLATGLDHTVDELGDRGSFDLFELTRRLGHRLGLASWAGPEFASGETFEQLAVAFDQLDGSAAFVHPDLMAAVAAQEYAAERAALETIVETLRPGLGEGPLPARVTEAWADAEPDVAARGRALDVALIHVASMSNMHAALGWLLVDLLTHREAAERVRQGDTAYAGQCALESTRLAQRSIMARTVLSPVTLNDGVSDYAVPAGWTIATLLPLLNTSAAPGLDTWDPLRWDRHRLADTSELASPRLVTAFGHGKHTCPAQPFSLAAMSTTAIRLLSTYDLTPQWAEHPAPVAAQIGGVARAAGPCPVSYEVGRV